MNEDTTVTPPVITKPKRKPKPTKPRAPRVIPPEEQAIRDSAKKQIEQYRLGLKSGKVLGTILKLCERLTERDRGTLVNKLSSWPSTN